MNNSATTILKAPAPHPLQVNAAWDRVAEGPSCSPTRQLPSWNAPFRLIRRGFSDDEWAMLSAQADFMARVSLATSIDDAEVVIRYGAELVEGNLPRPDSLPSQSLPDV